MHECYLGFCQPRYFDKTSPTDVLSIYSEAVMASNNMTEDEPSSELDYDEKKPDFDDKSADKDTYSNGSNGSNCNSEIGVHGPFHNRFYISIVIFLVVFALGVISGMIVGFGVQQHQISKLEHQLTAQNKSLSERIDDLQSQFLLHDCKHCNSTAYSDSCSYDDQDLRMKLDKIAAAQTDIWSQLNSTQVTLSNHGQQIIVVQQQAQENISRIENKILGLDVLVTNMSEQINHLFLMRDDHSDQLNQINSNISSIFTQLTHFNGSVNNLASRLETQRSETASLSGRLSTLDLHVDDIDRRDTTKDAQLEHEISQNEQRINGIQSDSARVSNQITSIKRRLDSLESSSAAAAFHPHILCSTVTLIVMNCIIMIIGFLVAS